MSLMLNYLDRFAPYRTIFNYRSAPKEILIECPACGESTIHQFEPLSHIDRYGYGVKTERCTFCDLIFVNPRMNAEHYARIYDAGIYRNLISAFSGGKDDHTFPSERVIGLSEHLKKNLGDRPVRVLNIGGTLSDYELLNKKINIKERNAE